MCAHYAHVRLDSISHPFNFFSLRMQLYCTCSVNMRIVSFLLQKGKFVNPILPNSEMLTADLVLYHCFVVDLK